MLNLETNFVDLILSNVAKINGRKLPPRQDCRRNQEKILTFNFNRIYGYQKEKYPKMRVTN